MAGSDSPMDCIACACGSYAPVYGASICLECEDRKFSVPKVPLFVVLVRRGNGRMMRRRIARLLVVNIWVDCFVGWCFFKGIVFVWKIPL